MGCNQYNIQEFLDKFWEGKTTLSEEQSIKDYFSYNEVPDHLHDEAAYFQMIREQKQTQILDDSFDDNLMDMIDSGHPKESKVFKMPIRFMGMAASILLIFGACWWAFTNTNDTDPPFMGASALNSQQNTEVNSEVKSAFDMTKSTLFMVSSKLNKGREQFNKIEKFNEAERLLHSTHSDSLTHINNTK